jgi:hypothetical protein
MIKEWEERYIRLLNAYKIAKITLPIEPESESVSQRESDPDRWLEPGV